MDTGVNILYGRKLRKLREYYNYSQKQCVEALKLKQQQDLSDLEKGKKQFTHQLLILICDFFKVSYVEFTSFQILDSSILPDKSHHLEQDVFQKADLILQINLLRKQILLKEIALIKAEQELSKRGKLPDNDLPIYVIV